MDLSTQNIGIAVLTLFLSACASPQIANIKYIDDAVVEQAAKTKQTPQQVCETASMAIAKANKEEFNFFAPLHLEQASDNLKKGQKEIKTEKTLAEGVKDCFKVNQLIDNGMVIKAKVKSSLSDALAELDMLKKVDEEKKFTRDIQNYVDDVIDLVKEIEEGKMNQAMQGQAELLKEMQELEINIVLNKNLRPVEAMLERADDADAKELAKKTFEKAETELESARKFIRVYYRDNEQVEKVSAIAMRKARHAYYVAKEVETLTELKPKAAEEKVLYIESLLERINKKFNENKITGYSLYEQTSIIARRLDTVLDARTLANRQLAILKQQLRDNLNMEKSLAKMPVEPGAQTPINVEQSMLSQPIVGKSEQTPVNDIGTDETQTAQPVADTPQQAPVDETQTAQPSADTPQQAPVDETQTAQPSADTPQQTPVDGTQTAQPSADTPQQTPVDETQTTQPVAEPAEPRRLDETKTVNLEIR
ncbi:MAG: hypothetical protein GXP11_00280 [Gammaproteobacteria bacterium]|nr:hypothetical protein [Gammaproteobacteria bacterium]